MWTEISYLLILVPESFIRNNLFPKLNIFVNLIKNYEKCCSWDKVEQEHVCISLGVFLAAEIWKVYAQRCQKGLTSAI